MELKDTINKIRLNLGMEVIDNSKQEKMEQLKWNIMFDNAIKVCEADEVEFDAQPYYVPSDEESSISVRHIIVPIAKRQKNPLSNLEDRLSKVGIKVNRNTYYETLQDREWEETKKQFNDLSDSEDFDFEIYTDITLAEEGYKVEINQRIVPVISKDEKINDEISNSDDSIARKIALHECLEYLLEQMNTVQFPFKAGKKTKEVFDDLLCKFSVSQIFYIIYRSITDAARYYQQKSEHKSGGKFCYYQMPKLWRERIS